MIREKLLISRALQAKLINTSIPARAKLLMLGKNSDGISIVAYPLKEDRYNGCSWMPGITGKELSRVLIRISEKGLQFGGFIHLSHNEQDRSGWNGMLGSNIYYHPPGTPFITFGPKHIRGRVRDKNNNVTPIYLKAVDISTKAKDHKEEQRHGRNTNSNSAVRKVNETPSKMRRTRRNNAW
jgi:hypothetical protein